jgi:hypothetical protein
MMCWAAVCIHAYRLEVILQAGLCVYIMYDAQLRQQNASHTLHPSFGSLLAGLCMQQLF